MRVQRRFVRVRYVGLGTNKQTNHVRNCAPFIESTVALLKAHLCFAGKFHQFTIWVEGAKAERVAVINSSNLLLPFRPTFCPNSCRFFGQPLVCVDVCFLFSADLFGYLIFVTIAKT